MNNRKQNGFVLVTALIFLLLMTYLSVAMFRGFNLDEMMAGNLREKSRATESAQAAISYAEWWLGQSGNATTGEACTAGKLTTPTVCSGTPGLASYVEYIPVGMTVSASGGIATYAAKPIYAIDYLGVDTTGKLLYSITARAQGGNQNAMAVLQTVYRITPCILACDLGGD